MSPAELRVFVNERGVSVPAGASALDAVKVNFPDDADGIIAGRLRLTDSRGLPVPPDTVVTGGSIFRVVTARERLEEATA
jgi:hypothetical protein